MAFSAPDQYVESSFLKSNLCESEPEHEVSSC